MSRFNKTVGSLTHSGSGNASGWQINHDAAHMKASNMAAESSRQRQGVLTPDEVTKQIRRFFESGQP
jgi:hypothetical protein